VPRELPPLPHIAAARDLTPEQERRRLEIDRRNAAIQATGVKPVHGNTFGTGKVK